MKCKQEDCEKFQKESIGNCIPDTRNNNWIEYYQRLSIGDKPARWPETPCPHYLYPFEP